MHNPTTITWHTRRVLAHLVGIEGAWKGPGGDAAGPLPQILPNRVGENYHNEQSYFLVTRVVFCYY
jgi:hypothetical protein